MKPVLAVTMWRRDVATFISDRTSLHTLVADYADAIDKAGAVALMVGHLDAEDADAVLDRVDGLLITGGGDIDPAAYGQANTVSERIEPNADERDLALIRAAQRRGTPVLGICRGLQAVNVAFGGALRQHVLGDDDAHPTQSDVATERNAHRHVVEFEPGCRLAEIYGTSERKVNSLHHQAVHELGEGLRVVGRTPGGSIEAVEGVDPTWPVLAVQWHPEMMRDDPAEDLLFRAFVEDVIRLRDR